MRVTLLGKVGAVLGIVLGASVAVAEPAAACVKTSFYSATCSVKAKSPGHRVGGSHVVIPESSGGSTSEATSAGGSGWWHNPLVVDKGTAGMVNPPLAAMCLVPVQILLCGLPVALPSTGGGTTQPATTIAPPPRPAILAQQAVAQMGLRAIDIGIVPEARPGSFGLVGLPTWMWVDNPSPTTWGPISATASAGGVSATVTANVDRVVWNMGDGSRVTCSGPGTPYVDAYDTKMSPDCGHRYVETSADQPNDAYTVTATSYWHVTWTAAGQSGAMDLQLARSVPLRIGEMQVLNTTG